MEIFLRAGISVRRREVEREDEREDEKEDEMEKRGDLVRRGDRESPSLTTLVTTQGGAITPRSERDPEEKVIHLLALTSRPQILLS